MMQVVRYYKCTRSSYFLKWKTSPVGFVPILQKKNAKAINQTLTYSYELCDIRVREVKATYNFTWYNKTTKRMNFSLIRVWE